MKYFDDLYVSGNIFTDSEKVAIEKEVFELGSEFCVKIEEVEQNISTLRNEVFEGDDSLKASLNGLDSKVEEHVISSAERFDSVEENLSNEVSRATTEDQRLFTEVDTIKQSVSNLREELLGENESLKTNLEEKDKELEGSINSLSDEVTRAIEGLQGQITADVKALTTHKIDYQNPHKVTLSQLVENGAEAIIPAGEVNDHCTLKIKAEDVNRNENHYVFEISPEQLSLHSGNSGLVFSDGEIEFTSVVSGVAGKNDYEFIIKSQLDNQFYVLDSKIDTTKSDLEVSLENQFCVLDNKIKEAISAETHFDFLVTPTLPETGVKGIIYLVNKSSSAEDQNFYEEYIWSGNGYEKIGDTRVDLSPYALKTDVSSAIDTSINKEVSDRNSAIEEAINNEVSNRNTAIAAGKALIEKAYKDADTLLENGLKNEIKAVSDALTEALAEESDVRSSKDSELFVSIETLKTLTDDHIAYFETKVNNVDTRVGSNEASISSINTELSNVNGKIESLTAEDTLIKANLDSVSQSVSTNTAAISALNGTVETKAEELEVVKTSLSTLNVTVGSHTESINESKEHITNLDALVSGEGGLLTDVAVLEEKVSNLEKADLSNRVASNETSIATINATIPTLATKTELEKELENKASVEYVDNTLAESKAYTDSEIEKIKKSNKYVEKFDVGASSDPSVSITLNHNIGENDCCVVQVYKNTTRGKELSSCDILIGDDGTITLTFYNVTENSSFTAIVMS